jgi:hypothetical protein
MGKFKGWPPSFKPTASRWATLQILVSTGLFFLAMFASLYAISISQGIVMIPLWLANILPIMLIIAFSLGVLCIIIVVGLIIRWLYIGSQDKTAEIIRNLTKKLKAEDVSRYVNNTGTAAPKTKKTKKNS